MAKRKRRLDRRRAVGAIVAMFVALIVYPNVVVTFQVWWQNRVNPFTFDSVESVPQTLSTVTRGIVSDPDGSSHMYELPGFSAIIEDVNRIGVPRDVLLSTRLARPQLSAGENVTFLVGVTSHVSEAVNLYVFIVDPFGIVRGAFPDGKIPYLYAIDPYPLLSPDVRNAMQIGRVAFTFHIPLTALSVGKWTTLVLGTTTTNWHFFITWTETSFTVQPQANAQWISFLQDATIVFGTPLTVYKLVVSKRIPAALKRVWPSLEKEWPLLLGLALMGLYLILKYLFP